MRPTSNIWHKFIISIHDVALPITTSRSWIYKTNRKLGVTNTYEEDIWAFLLKLALKWIPIINICIVGSSIKLSIWGYQINRHKSKCRAGIRILKCEICWSPSICTGSCITSFWCLHSDLEPNIYLLPRKPRYRQTRLAAPSARGLTIYQIYVTIIVWNMRSIYRLRFRKLILTRVSQISVLLLIDVVRQVAWDWSSIRPYV